MTVLVLEQPVPKIRIKFRICGLIPERVNQLSPPLLQFYFDLASYLGISVINDPDDTKGKR